MASKKGSTYQELIQEIREGKVSPVYFLMGEEVYFIDRITEVLEKELLPEEQRAFNQLVFYGKDSDLRMIIEAAMRHPMMSDRQVVLVKEAQDLSYKGLEDEHHPLASYLRHPNPTTVLAFAYKHRKPERGSALLKLLQGCEGCRLFEAAPIRDYEMPEWIMSHLSGRGIQTDMKAAMLLTEYAGDTISNVMNALEKLLLLLPEGETRLTAAHIEKYAGYSKEFNIFELQKAIATRDVSKANRIARHFCNDPKNHPLQKTIAFLYPYFLKLMLLHSYRNLPRQELKKKMKTNSDYYLRELEKTAQRYSFTKLRGIMAALRKTDARSKGIGNVSADTCELMKELLFYILH